MRFSVKNRHVLRGIIIIPLLFVVGMLSASAQPWYYHGRDFGSESQYSPLSYIINGGYDILQLDTYRDDVFTYPYASSASTVFRNLGRPLPLINRYGWGRYLRHEIVPLEFSRGASWWPNYQLHLIGGGMSYRRMTEWYAHHGFDVPQAWSAGTVMGMHLLNEVMENNAREGEFIDPIADIWIFDIAGILLFESDAVARFFSEELRLTDWSLQPSISLTDGTLQNVGQNFVLRWQLPFWEDYSLMYVFGINGMAGLSRRLADGESLSLVAGLRARDVFQAEDNPLRLTANLTWSASLYYDRNNSLLASLEFSGISSNLITLNVYPGVVHVAGWSPGLWGTVTTDGGFMAGIAARWLPGVAVR